MLFKSELSITVLFKSQSLILSVHFSWAVLRGQQLDPTYHTQLAPQTAGGATAGATDDWGMDADDWGDDDDNGDFPPLEESCGSTGNTIGNNASTIEKHTCTEGNISSTEENMTTVANTVWTGATWTTDKHENSPEIPQKAESSTLADTTDDLEAMSIDDGPSNELIAEDLLIKPEEGESILCRMLQPSHPDPGAKSGLEIPGLFLAVIEDETEKESYKHEAELLREYVQKEGVNIQEMQEEAFM